jgi:ketosteroid isomerase-like protein
MKLLGVSILVFGLLCSGCASIPSNGRREALLSADRDWAAVASEGKDVKRIISFWSDDATITPAGAPLITGKVAIRKFVEDSLATPGFHIGWRPEQASVSADGTMGYTTGENTNTFPGTDGKLMTVTGRYVTVWRRDSSGTWKCVADIWNSGP